jgi:hypothetical protein
MAWATLLKFYGQTLSRRLTVLYISSDHAAKWVNEHGFWMVNLGSSKSARSLLVTRIAPIEFTCDCGARSRVCISVQACRSDLHD